MAEERLVIAGLESLRTRAADELLEQLRNGPTGADPGDAVGVIRGLLAIIELRAEGWPVRVRVEEDGTHFWSLPWHRLEMPEK